MPPPTRPPSSPPRRGPDDGPHSRTADGGRQRRALSHQGVGEIETRGESEVANQLAAALACGAQSLDVERVTHGFHSYPARMHPAIAAELIARFSPEGSAVLDPFCGSGTVLIEAMRAGRRAVGVDLSPLALRVAEVQTVLRDAEARTRFVQQLDLVQIASLERVRARVRSRAPLSERERSFYSPHVLLELAGLREEIAKVEPDSDRRAMEMVFSSLLVKFSTQRGDTSEEPTEKRIRKGLVSEFFLRKGTELARRWQALEHDAGPNAVPPRLVLGDARELPILLRDVPRFPLVLSSPPYGGTYDYHAHHARRYPWLGLDASALERGEVGARRRLSTVPDGAQRWERELLACLRAIAYSSAPGGAVVLLVGDPEVGSERLDAADQLRALAPQSGFSAEAAASQPRPDALGGRPRNEHIVLLRRHGLPGS